MLLQPPLGAGKVDLASAGEKEGDGVSRMGTRGGVEGRQEPGNLKGEILARLKQPNIDTTNLTSRSMETPDPLLSAPVARLKIYTLQKGPL